VLLVRNLTVRFGGLTAVRDFDLEIPDVGIVALVGPNGAGKTTLLNALSRVTPASAGRVQLDGVDVLALAPHDVVRAGIARSFQKAEVFETLTVLENVLVGLHVQMTTGIEGALPLPAVRAQEARARERAEALLRRLHLWSWRNASPAALPYGHRKLLDVARALVSEPKLLLLDEPFAGLTEAEAPALLRCIAEAGKNRAILMIEHHFELLEGTAQRITVMDFGRKVAEGPPAQVRSDPEVVRCYLGTARSGGTGASQC
jgi:branched-chain amino acid transport system ATP-binding protein